MKILELSCINISTLFDSIKKIRNPLFPFFYLVLQLMQVSFVILSFLLSQPVLLLEKSLKLAFIISQSLDDL